MAPIAGGIRQEAPEFIGERSCSCGQRYRLRMAVGTTETWKIAEPVVYALAGVRFAGEALDADDADTHGCVRCAETVPFAAELVRRRHGITFRGRGRARKLDEAARRRVYEMVARKQRPVAAVAVSFGVSDVTARNIVRESSSEPSHQKPSP